MSNLWKKANFPSIEELAKEVAVKKRLTIELGRSIRTLQVENIGMEGPISGSETVSNVCSILEAIFIHGLKTKFSVSAVFGNNANRMPEVDFWSVAMVCSHKDIVTQITRIKALTTDIGRCRAWLRVALNDGLILSYVDTMTSDQSILKNHYDPVAYLRDREEPDIMKQLLEGLAVFTFQLPFDASTLNVWNDTPLVLAGIWTPPVSPQPVMPAVDVIEFFTDQEPKTHGRSTHREIVLGIPKGNSAQPHSPLVSGIESVQHCDKTDSASQMSVHVHEVKQEDVQNVEKLGGVLSDALPSFMEKTFIDHDEQEVENASKISSSGSIPDCIPDVSPHGKTGSNSLLLQSGWSSEFEYEEEVLPPKVRDDPDAQSYDSLLQSYNKNMSSGIFGTPDTSDMILSGCQPPVSDDNNRVDYETVSVESKSPDTDYEIVPRSCFLPDGADERTRQLLSIIGEICPEKGLDIQNYQCRGCGCGIGLIYGKAHLCYYDGFSYCSDCHGNEEYYIPARMVHNWDFKKYPVSKYTKLFLIGIEQQPFLNLKILNPLIYSAIEEMAQLQRLRMQLTFLRSYIFTCKESIAEELRKKIWPKEYLYEHVHLYCVADMLQAASGSLQSTLQKLIAFAKKHVLSCTLCHQKGFICEICANAKVIYPFDLDTTYHCDFCSAVYHCACMEMKKYCPKCERKKKRQEMVDSSWCIE